MSVHPTEILRILVIGLSILWLVGAERRMRRAEDAITSELFPASSAAHRRGTSGRHLPRTRVSRLWMDLLTDLAALDLRRAFRASQTTNPWNCWRVYLQWGHPELRWTRTVFSGLLFALVAWGIFEMVGYPPAAPARGSAVLALDRALQIASNTAVVLVTLWLFDATLLTWRFVRRLAQTRSAWPADDLQPLATRWGVAPDDVTELAEIEAIARLTRSLWSALGMPFVLVALLVVSRSRFFDGWSWPWSLVLLLALLLSIALASALLLRLTAQAARRQALRSLMERRSQHRNPGGAGEASLRAAHPEQIELMEKAIRLEQRGALGGWWANPLARTAVLLAIVLVLVLLDLTYA